MNHLIKNGTDTVIVSQSHKGIRIAMIDTNSYSALLCSLRLLWTVNILIITIQLTVSLWRST